MKKFLGYLAVAAAIVAAGCTEFGEEIQVTLPDAPDVVISNVTAVTKDSISFTVAPADTAGFYGWVVVKSDVADAAVQAERVLKQQHTGVAKGLVNYATDKSKVVGVGKLTPFTVYQIYAVVASKDGKISAVKNAQIRTLDDGSKPTPQKVAIADSTVTLTFSEPLKRGTGKVFVSYFAKNTVSGANPLVIQTGYESYNPQDLVIDSKYVSVSGNNLVIKLPGAPAGAYASITYEAGAVTDIEGNGVNPYVKKADTLVSGVPTRGVTVRLATKTWTLNSEFAALNPDTLASFSTWNTATFSAVPAPGIKVSKKVASVVPTFAYNEPHKKSIVKVKTWGLASATGLPLFALPEEPARGAIIDLNIPAGAFEDVYGNTNEALDVEGNYIYSYGYTLADIVGEWQINGINATSGAAITPENVTIVANTSTANNAFDVLIKGMGKAISGSDSEVEADFDPVTGTLTVVDWQVIATDWVHPQIGTPADLYFATSAAPAIDFKMTSSGNITSANEAWGYYLAKGATGYGFVRRYAPNTTWTKSVAPATVPAKVRALQTVPALDTKTRKVRK
jgi:hypothetical protein